MRHKKRNLSIGTGLLGLGLTLALWGCASFPYSNETVTAKVTNIDGEKVTLQVGETQNETPMAPGAQNVDFQRVSEAALTVGDTSVYSVDEATRQAASYDLSSFDGTFAITFNEDAIAYDCPAVTNEMVDDVCVLSINAGGSYSFSGTLSSGQIVVATNDPVEIQLNNVVITNTRDSVISRSAGGTLVVTAVEGSSNQLITTAAASQSKSDGVATISSVGSVILNGSGALYLESASGCGVEALATPTSSNGEANLNGVIGVHGATLGIKAGNHGLYAEDYLLVTDGLMDISCDKDGLATFGDCTFAGGNGAFDAGDDGIHADRVLVFEGGELNVGQCEEGLEAEKIYMREGSCQIKSDDDGINAAAPEAYDDEMPTGYSEVNSCLIAMGGGALRINASGDGIDSNGSFQMNGGTVLVSAPGSGDNSALDCDGAKVLVGGLAVLTGAPGMGSGFTEADQPYVNSAISGSAGSSVALTDDAGTILLAWTPLQDFSVLTMTTSGLSDNGAYSIIVGGEITPANAANQSGVLSGLATQGTVEGGDAYAVTASTSQSASATEPGNGREGQTRMYGAPQGAMGQQPKSAPPDANGEQPQDPGGTDRPPSEPSGEPPTDNQVPNRGDRPTSFKASDDKEITITLDSEQVANLKVGSIVIVTFGNGSQVTSIEVIGIDQTPQNGEAA